MGTGIIPYTWAIYEIITGDYKSSGNTCGSILYFFCLCIEYLKPKLIGDSVGMSPFFDTYINVYFLQAYRYASGLIVGIPIAMVLQAFYEGGVF